MYTHIETFTKTEGLKPQKGKNEINGLENCMIENKMHWSKRHLFSFFTGDKKNIGTRTYTFSYTQTTFTLVHTITTIITQP